MNFLFWNINKKDLTESIVRLSVKHEIDVIILAESEISDTSLLLSLNEKSTLYFPSHPLSKCKKIRILTRFHYDFIQPITESDRFTIRKISLPSREPILLTSVHFLDKGNHSAESQSIESSILKRKIDSTEKKENINKNIVVGDMNMNPFEIAMINTNGFHATMSEDIALNVSRTVQGIDYKYFYNPMWSLYGDLISKPSGTYFYQAAEHVAYQWHLFDQVLLRPQLITNFDKSSLEIISTDGIKSFLTANYTPNRKDFSDHLPIKFTLNI